ncbi:MAG: hypothetical protein ABIF09_07405, partial [Gemmatimonadota bacterium]
MGLDEQAVLHRFHSLLVREFGSRYPWDLDAPLTVADIKYNLVPFQSRREELGVTTDSDYDRDLLGADVHINPVVQGAPMAEMAQEKLRLTWQFCNACGTEVESQGSPQVPH